MLDAAPSCQREGNSLILTLLFMGTVLKAVDCNHIVCIENLQIIVYSSAKAFRGSKKGQKHCRMTMPVLDHFRASYVIDSSWWFSNVDVTGTTCGKSFQGKTDFTTMNFSLSQIKHKC